MIERFGTVELVVVGSMNVDQIVYCQRFPDDGETLVAERYVQGFGGKGANQAVMAARLGAHVAMIGCLGHDDLGDATTANLAAMAVDSTGVTRVAGVSSGVAPIWVDESGTNRILIVPGANGALTARQVTDVLAGRRAAHAVVAQLETPQVATAAAFVWARTVGALTVLNPAPAAPVEPDVLAHVGWLVANESEFTLLYGSEPSGRAVGAAAGEWRCGVVVTLGAAGALVAANIEAAASVPAPAVTAVDTTGAGDAFVGTFAVSLAAGLAPHEAVRLGCVAGALSVQRHGTQPSFPTAAELETAATQP
jgi:ribokinase